MLMTISPNIQFRACPPVSLADFGPACRQAGFGFRILFPLTAFIWGNERTSVVFRIPLKAVLSRFISLSSTKSMLSSVDFCSKRERTFRAVFFIFCVFSRLSFCWFFISIVIFYFKSRIIDTFSEHTG